MRSATQRAWSAAFCTDSSRLDRPPAWAHGKAAQSPIAEIAGLTAGHDHAVLRGDPEGGAFSVFCYKGGALIGIESVNRPADHAQARRLLSAGRHVSPDEAADDSFDLRAAAARRG